MMFVLAFVAGAVIFYFIGFFAGYDKGRLAELRYQQLRMNRE